MRIEQKQSQSLRLSISMQQSLRLLSMSALELESYLNKCIEENPLLEPQEGSAPTELFRSFLEKERESGYFTGTFKDYFYNLSHSESFKEKLLHQLGELPGWKLRQWEEAGTVLKSAAYIIESLDERGFLLENLKELAVELHKPISILRQALELVQSLEPAGVGAKDVEECLLLQAKKLYPKDELLYRLISYELEALAQRNYEQLAHKYKVTLQKLQESANKLTKLNPNPAAGFQGKEQTVYVLPEAVVNQALEISYLRPETARLHLNEKYLTLLERDEATKKYLKEQLQKSSSLLKGLEERDKTIKLVIDKLVELQGEYLLGKGQLQPLTQKKLGEFLQLHESTISRTVKDKYILTEQGMLALSTLFSGLAGKGAGLSVQAVKHKLLHLLQQENSQLPLSDRELELLLKKQGIAISRRTVTKYREAMGIGTASQRKKLYSSRLSRGTKK